MPCLPRLTILRCEGLLALPPKVAGVSICEAAGVIFLSFTRKNSEEKQMRKYHRPHVEQLGERVLPSATSLILPPGLTSLTKVAHHQQPLTGNGAGTYTGASLIVDAGANYTLLGEIPFVK